MAKFFHRGLVLRLWITAAALLLCLKVEGHLAGRKLAWTPAWTEFHQFSQSTLQANFNQTIFVETKYWTKSTHSKLSSRDRGMVETESTLQYIIVRKGILYNNSMGPSSMYHPSENVSMVDQLHKCCLHILYFYGNCEITDALALRGANYNHLRSLRTARTM